MGEYDISVLKRAAKVVSRRSSKEQTVLDDIATKLKVLADQPAEASGPSGPEDEEEEDDDEEEKEDVKGLTLEERIKILRKKIKARIMKRIRVMEKMQHKELVARVAHLEKMKQKVLGHSLEDPEKPGKFLSHRGPGDDSSDNSNEESAEPENSLSEGVAAKSENDASGPEQGDADSDGSGPSGASGPKVLDDSNNPVYKLTGKEPEPPTPKGCTNGCPGNKIVPPGQKPIWHRVAELDHNAFPEIIDDPNAKEKDHTITGDKYIDMDAPKKKPKTVVSLDKIVEGGGVPEGMEKAKMKVVSSDKAAEVNSWIQ